jgi:hypothetical protein
MRQTRSATGIAVATCLFLVVWGLTTHGKYSASGDEPHYLLVALSLAADHDLDLANNYAANDGRLIGHDQLTADAHARRARDGRLLSTHDIGLPILLAPVYAAAAAVATLPSESTLARFRMSRGLFTYALISLTILALVSSSVALLITGLTYIAPARVAAAVGAAVALSPPILSHSFLVFPEAAAFAAACAVVWWTLSPSPSERATFALIAALALLPWCHRKYTIFVIACAVMMVASRWAFWSRLSREKQLSAIVLFAAPHLFLYWWTFTTWGNLGGPQMLAGVPLTLGGMGRGLAGLWLDRQYGLLAYSPIYLLLPAYWAIAAGTVPWAALPVVAMIVPMAAFVEWWGGFSPAARYLVPIVPFCALAATHALRNRVVWLTAIVLLMPQALIVGYAWQHPRTLWPIDDRNPLLMQLGPVGRAYERALPSLRYGELGDAVVAGLVLVALNAGVVVLVWCRDRTAAATH